MHESRHRHAVKRCRGYSGRFRGKESPQKSPDPPIIGSLPHTLPLIYQPLTSTGPLASISDVVTIATTGSTSDVVSTSIVRGGGAVPRYQSVVVAGLGEAPGLRGLNVVPEMMIAANKGDTLPVTSVNTTLVSLPLNQLGVTQPSLSTGSLVPAMSSGQEDTESLGDVTIQGLINAAQTFSVPILPTTVTSGSP